MLKFTKEDKVKIIDPKSDLVNILDADGWVFEEDPKTKPKGKIIEILDADGLVFEEDPKTKPEGKKAKKVKKSKNNG